MKKNQVAYGVRVKLNDKFEIKCLGDTYLKEQEDVIFISDAHVYNDTVGEYVHIKGGSLINSGYAYLNQLELEFPIPQRPIEVDMSELEVHLIKKRKENVMNHQHIMNCIESELLNAKDGDEIRINIQGDKAEIWNGNIYTGSHLFKK